MRAKWKISRTPNGADATYEGRKGLASALTTMTSRGTDEMESAIGSQVKFEINRGDEPGVVECSMWLASRATKWGFTADGRFFRPYMRAVEGKLAAIDPNVRSSKA